VDYDYNSVNGVDYVCDSTAGTTYGDGEFSFYPGDYCTFYLDNQTEYLFIVDMTNTGKNGIDYHCNPSGISGETGDYVRSGGFDYATDDACTFAF
jgi:hypothetical protein